MGCRGADRSRELRPPFCQLCRAGCGLKDWKRGGCAEVGAAHLARAISPYFASIPPWEPPPPSSSAYRPPEFPLPPNQAWGSSKEQRRFNGEDCKDPGWMSPPRLETSRETRLPLRKRPCGTTTTGQGRICFTSGSGPAPWTPQLLRVVTGPVGRL
ncbi:hypothetical protein NDU88_006033 [Pleurodeles waltl]|uniref:Uncharacterized protein n=1 Tax=Pleurodeles waltl TaxID=8319 RepID=A0AAV7TYX6_PLEWA|nr:hypothetical protein NDU88_006033 [Pleurodeles waltl]